MFLQTSPEVVLSSTPIVELGCAKIVWLNYKYWVSSIRFPFSNVRRGLAGRCRRTASGRLRNCWVVGVDVWWLSITAQRSEVVDSFRLHFEVISKQEEAQLNQ